MLRGSDISAYQDAIPAGDFCVMKASEGVGYIDPPFASRWKTLAQRGVLRGAYHFARPDSNGPAAEADHFLSVVLSAGLKPGDLLVLDHETPGSSPSHDATWAQSWCAHVQAKTGVRPLVYTFLSFAQEGRCAGLGGYPLWMADPSRPAGQPRVPSPWSSWALHQYGSPGGVDVDVFNGDKAAWLALGGGTPTPTPAEDDDLMPYGQLADGAQAITPISLPKGRYKTIGFIADNGLQGLPPAQLRVALDQGGGNWHVEKISVDSAKGQAVIVFPDVANTDGISVRREDGGAVHVAWEVS